MRGHCTLYSRYQVNATLTTKLRTSIHTTKAFEKRRLGSSTAKTTTSTSKNTACNKNSLFCLTSFSIKWSVHQWQDFTIFRILPWVSHSKHSVTFFENGQICCTKCYVAKERSECSWTLQSGHSWRDQDARGDHGGVSILQQIFFFNSEISYLYKFKLSWFWVPQHLQTRQWLSCGPCHNVSELLGVWWPSTAVWTLLLVLLNDVCKCLYVWRAHARFVWRYNNSCCVVYRFTGYIRDHQPSRSKQQKQAVFTFCESRKDPQLIPSSCLKHPRTRRKRLQPTRCRRHFLK